jgi:PAT family beta-lactamase induction signal transducer AmpG
MKHSLRTAILYIVEALSYVITTTIAVFMLKRLGYPNSLILVITSGAFGAWCLKPLVKRALTFLASYYFSFVASGLIIVWQLSDMAYSLLERTYTSRSVFTNLLVIILATTVFSSAKDLYIRLHMDRRSIVYANYLNSILYHIILILGEGLIILSAGFMEILFPRISLVWSYVFFAIAIVEGMLMLAIALLFTRKMPRLRNNVENVEVGTMQHNSRREMAEYMLSMFFFLLPNISILRLRPLFFIDRYINGGVELTLLEIGWVQGTIGIIAYTIGHVWGYHLLHRKNGQKARVWIALLWAVPSLMFLLMNVWQPRSLFYIGIIVFINQLCIGLGINLITQLHPRIHPLKRISGNNPFTSSSVVLVTLPIVLGVGYLQEWIGYRSLFCILSLISIFYLIYQRHLNEQ